jgi:DNA invertase Pin-like site-specific DNA recombinase
MAYVFCRVSTGRGCSLDYQEDKIKSVLAQLNWNIRETIKCTGSAYNEVPARLNELSGLKGKKIVFYCVDRFSRNYTNGVILAKKFISNKNELYFVTEKLKLATSCGPEWETFCTYLRAAETESDKISARVSASKKYLESKGYFTGAKAPFGYKKVKLENGKSRLVSDPNADNLLQFIDECKSEGTPVSKLNNTLAKCGANTKKYPLFIDEGTKVLETDLRYDNIADILNDYEVPGGPWTKSKISRIYKNYSVTNLSDDFNKKATIDKKRKFTEITKTDDTSIDVSDYTRHSRRKRSRQE